MFVIDDFTLTEMRLIDVFYATFNDISVILWWSVLVMEKSERNN